MVQITIMLRLEGDAPEKHTSVTFSGCVYPLEGRKVPAAEMEAFFERISAELKSRLT
jgi:hypothetical protein